MDFASSVRYAYGHADIADDVLERSIGFLKSDADDEAKHLICTDMDVIADLAGLDNDGLIADLRRVVEAIDSPPTEYRLQRSKASSGPDTRGTRKDHGGRWSLRCEILELDESPVEGLRFEH